MGSIPTRFRYSGAGSVQERLAAFNKGIASGVRCHCGALATTLYKDVFTCRTHDALGQDHCRTGRASSGVPNETNLAWLRLRLAGIA
jgi:hypothetical protein